MKKVDMDGKMTSKVLSATVSEKIKFSKGCKVAKNILINNFSAKLQGSTKLKKQKSSEIASRKLSNKTDGLLKLSVDDNDAEQF
jgi:predicted DNA-binding antitoxin AbrB/MazE fold protein